MNRAMNEELNTRNHERSQKERGETVNDKRLGLLEHLNRRQRRARMFSKGTDGGPKRLTIKAYLKRQKRAKLARESRKQNRRGA